MPPSTQLPSLFPQCKRWSHVHIIWWSHDMNTAENRKTNDDERLALELPTQTEALEENTGSQPK